MFKLLIRLDYISIVIKYLLYMVMVMIFCCCCLQVNYFVHIYFLINRTKPNGKSGRRFPIGILFFEI